jgi:hypothetical protein
MFIFWEWLRVNRGAVELFLVVVSVAVVILIASVHERDVGARQCTSANTEARVAELVRDATQRATDADAINQQARNYVAYLDYPAAGPVFAPPVFLCPAPGARRELSAAAPPGRVRDGAAELPGADRGRAGAGPEIGKPLGIVGRHADAQVIELQAYIRDVCRPAGVS